MSDTLPPPSPTLSISAASRYSPANQKDWAASRRSSPLAAAFGAAMPSSYDILGTVFGVLSLLGCVRCAYGFLKARQPLAQAVRLEEMLRATHQRIDELQRYGYFAGNPTLAATHRIDEGSITERWSARITRPKTIVAVLLYTVQHGINSERSRGIRLWAKEVSFIRHQVDYSCVSLSGLFRISELGTGAEISPPSGVEATSDTEVATSSGMEVLAVPEATFTQRSHIYRRVPRTARMRSWANPSIPKTVHGGVRLGAIDLLRQIWRAHWNNSNTPGSDETSQDNSQDGEEVRIVANWNQQGTAEASSTHNGEIGAVEVHIGMSYPHRTKIISLTMSTRLLQDDALGTATLAFPDETPIVTLTLV
ncbi:hypothetical protein VTO73DRAFT_11632 [Trametes versicolor]